MNIAIVGAGTIGTGFAQLAMLAGNAVALYDTSTQALQRAQLRITRELEEGVQKGVIDYHKSVQVRKLLGSTTILEHCAEADVVIESAPEQLELKKMLFERLDKVAPQAVILASCTSTIPLTVMAGVAKRYPERVIGTHFLTNVQESKLVEIVRADQTSATTVDQIVTLMQQLGKEIIISKDAPGFVVNRVTSAYTNEALRLLGEGNLTAEAIDKLMESLEFKAGPFRLMDEAGIDTNLSAKQALYDATFHEPRFRPHFIQQKMVQAGLLGRKTKQGFHKYNE